MVPYVSSGRDYRCARCREVIPEGSYVDSAAEGDALVWVKAVNTDGDVLHECGEVSGG